MAKLDTKNDLNRVGLFSELGYISIGDPYKRQSTSKYQTPTVVKLFVAIFMSVCFSAINCIHRIKQLFYFTVSKLNGLSQLIHSLLFFKTTEAC